MKCFTGGAIGIDTMFIELCQELGIDYEIMSFEEHNCKFKDRFILDQKNLEKADSYLKEVANILKKKLPSNSYILNLLRRNFHTMCHSEIIIAISKLNNGRPSAGTEWTIELAKLFDRKIYLYDTKSWCYWDYNTERWQRMMKDPIINGNFAGIGSRNIKIDKSIIEKLLVRQLINESKQKIRDYKDKIDDLNRELDWESDWLDELESKNI